MARTKSNNSIPLIFSILMVGMGQIIKGDAMKGIAQLALCSILVAVGIEHTWMFGLAGAVWIWSIYDAWNN